MAENKLTRSDFAVALGGGVTGDIEGLASLLYLRGFEFVQVPTTLLTAVDSSVGGDVTETEDGLIIKGKPSLIGGETDSFNDHRIAVAAAVASLKCKDNVIIRNAQALNKSYPSFFDDFNKLGEKSDVV